MIAALDFRSVKYVGRPADYDRVRYTNARRLCLKGIYHMANALPLEVVCEDFLKDNRRFYVHKARRKKIALIAVEAICTGGSGPVTLDLGAAELVTDKKRHGVEPTATSLFLVCLELNG